MSIRQNILNIKNSFEKSDLNKIRVGLINLRADGLTLDNFASIYRYFDRNKRRFASATAMILMGAVLVGSTLTYNAKDNASAYAGISALTNVDADSEVILSDSDVVTTAASSDSHYGYTNLGIANCEGNLNVREQASESADLVGKLPEHAGLEVVSQTEDGWTQIKSGEVEGFVKSEYILTGDEAVKLADSVATYLATVTADVLYLRSEPSTDSKVLYRMPKDEKVEILEELGDWIKVSVDDEEGYCAAEYVTCAVELKTAATMDELRYGGSVSDTRVALVNNACQYVGNRYVWGGTSLTRGADCSGFVLAIFAQYGISLPHSSRGQANFGTKISASDAQPGDLFFYGSGKRISHVAIYIGNGQIVHASNHRDGIKISNAYYRTPICVRSLIN